MRLVSVGLAVAGVQMQGFVLKWGLVWKIVKGDAMTSSERKRMYLIDGNAYMYRSFYAIRDLRNAQGQPTNALFGFTNLLLKILREQKPDYLAVAFDSKGPTKRHEQFEEYKIHRKPMPEELVPQMSDIKDILQAFSIPVYEKSGYEADDILATMAEDAKSQGLDVFIVTGDKDMLQLVDEHTFILSVHKDNFIYDQAKIEEKYGIKPEFITDYLGLVGDASDNIPGVPGVGAKTATALIQQFGGIESILNQVDQISSKSQQSKLREHAQSARMSKELATLDRFVPDCPRAQECVLREPNYDALRELFQKFEFFKFIRDMELTVKVKPAQALVVKDVADVQMILDEARKPSTLTFFYDFLGDKDGLELGLGEKSFFFKWSHCDWVGHCADLSFDDFRRLLMSGHRLCAYDFKPLLKRFRNWAFEGDLWDLKIMAYLLYPGKNHYELAALMEEYGGASWQEGDELSLWGRRLAAMEKMGQVLGQKLAEMDLEELYLTMERPLINVLAHVEDAGICVDVPFLQGLSDKLEQELSRLTAEIYREAGSEFNINSPKQLATVLFEDLGLPSSKKTKTGYSTSVEVLEKLAEEYVLPALILEYRQYHKLKSTYVDALPRLVDAQSRRVHTTLHQEGTATGRLSSSDPNLQNIPIRSELGRDIRKAFISPREDTVIVSADYSQIELRILAHLSNDATMKQAFAQNADIHRKTAAEIMSLEESEVTDEMRRMAKAINFGLIYGKTPFGLSKDLNIPIYQAKEFIESYFTHFSSVRSFMDECVLFAREHGFARTMFKRIRYLPDIHSGQKMTREFAERMAINTPVQGSAADVIKKAMLEVERCLQQEQCRTQMVLQIHDELLFEVPREELSFVQERIKACMEQAVSLSVPLTVNMSFGANWAEAH